MQGPALTVNEVALKLKFDAATVRAMLQAKIIRGVKLCGRWRVDPAEIDRLFQKNDPAKTKQMQRRSLAAMAKLGLQQHHGAFAPECAGIFEPSVYHDDQAGRQG